MSGENISAEEDIKATHRPEEQPVDIAELIKRERCHFEELHFNIAWIKNCFDVRWLSDSNIVQEWSSMRGPEIPWISS